MRINFCKDFMNLNIPHKHTDRTFLKPRLMALLLMAVMLVPIYAGESGARRKGSSRNKSEFTVVIDAGHGGHDHGAIDNGAREKDINLGVAKKLASLLKKKGKGINVVMTRDDDTFISLQERANIANRNKGNLFISIHTNSVDKSNPNRKTVQGASVYALGPQKDANNLKVAQRENSVIELESDYHQKYSGFDPSKDESYIIFEMAQKKNLGQSLKFAEKAQKQLVKTAGRGDRGVKQAGFWVLWATSMPSVLVELDFICNPRSAEYLNSDKGQEELAQALFNAVEAYIKAQKNPTADNNTEKNSENRSAESGLEIAAGDSAEGNALLIASSQQAKAPRKAHVEQRRTPQKTGIGSRRRRSESSRRISENRNIEAESITLKSETDFLAVREEPREEVKQTQDTDDSDADKKGKSGKKKKSKQKKSKEKKVKPDTTKSKKDKSGRKDKNPNQKTFVVKNVSSQEVKRENTAAKAAATPAKHQSAGKMVYQIQILASDTERQPGDPEFCGIVPTGMFRENGLYKYTYGSSESRSEIERKLLEIKPVIPGAVIVVRME